MKRFLYPLAAVGALGGACFAAVVGATVRWLACENEGTEACRRADLADTQFYVALAGLAPALLLVYATLRSRSWAILPLGVGLVLYAVWTLLLDAAVHGWDDLKLLP